MNLITMIITFSVSAIILYFINIYFDMGRRKVSFKKSFIYFPNIILAIYTSIALNILHLGFIITFILWIIMKILLNKSYGKE